MHWQAHAIVTHFLQLLILNATRASRDGGAFSLLCLVTRFSIKFFTRRCYVWFLRARIHKLKKNEFENCTSIWLNISKSKLTWRVMFGTASIFKLLVWAGSSDFLSVRIASISWDKAAISGWSAICRPAKSSLTVLFIREPNRFSRNSSSFFFANSNVCSNNVCHT